MSKVVKTVGKVFKKVVKVVKKVAPIALGVGALVFTAGAALGVPALAGGWGAATSAISSTLGPTLAPVVTGALTQAGYGALAGGAIAGVTGGDVMSGLKSGALTGAVTGGVMGGLGMGTDPFKGIGETRPAVGAMPSGQQVVADALPGSVNPALETTTVAASQAAPTAAVSTAQGSGLGSFLQNNPILAGSIVQGLGQGLSASAEADAYRERLRQIAKNYDRTGLDNGGIASGLGGVPSDPNRFDIPVGQWVIDPTTGKYIYTTG